MKYKFLGKPDKKFSKLITGRIYELDVTAIVGLPFRPLILKPFKCPYSNWETFYQNWEPVIQNKPYEPIIQDKLFF